MHKYLLSCLLALLITIQANAQQDKKYTADNSIFIIIEGNDGLYEYKTDVMLVRYNEDTKKVECLVNVAALEPANDSSATVLPQDIFFASNYPDLLIEIDAPVEKINAGNLYPERIDQEIRLRMHNIPIVTTAPVVFTPDERSLHVSTTFDLILSEHNIPIPAKYIPMLSGRIRFYISDAHAVEFFPQ